MLSEQPTFLAAHVISKTSPFKRYAFPHMQQRQLRPGITLSVIEITLLKLH